MTTPNRAYGPRSLAGPLSRVTRPILRRRGLASAQVVSKWREIMGPQLAAQSIPQRYQPERGGGGTLHIRVGGGWATEFQHLEPQIIDRINTYFGYRAVSRLVLRQGPVPQPPQSKTRSVDGTHEPGPAVDVPVRDDDLRTALERLGQAVRRSHKEDKKT
ncbi:MAG: DUF721 domain-containing protein [Alphaproteobacteria bacterium]|nr:DUF721 domain-containing protein [Alphaproteobacteria bacterium]